MSPTRLTEPHDEQATVRTPCGGSGSVVVAAALLGLARRRGRGEQGVLAGRAGVASVGRQMAMPSPAVGCPPALAAVPLGGLLLHRQPVQRPFPQRVWPVRH